MCMLIFGLNTAKESVQNQNIFNADRSLADNPSDNENSSHKNGKIFIYVLNSYLF